MTRRRLATVVLPVALIAACRNDASDTERDVSGQSSRASAIPAIRQPRGELKIATDFSLMRGFDPRTATGNALPNQLGAGEALTRLKPDGKIERRLAESVTQIGPTVWRVTLRPNARFHDGSPVTAEDVATCFRRVWEAQPAAARFVPKETAITTPDVHTLIFTLPAPLGIFPNSISYHSFTIFKETTAGLVLTGPYRPTQVEGGDQLTLQAFPDHWAGPPPIATLQLRFVPDANTRLLALQSGDIDLATALAPEQVKGLPADLERAVAPSGRIHYVVFNLQRPIFGDRVVREAVSLGIDRASLNKAAFDGNATAIGSYFPPDLGVAALPAPAADPVRARQQLDAAGWQPGGDGVRVKDGRRLAFTLYHRVTTSPPRAMAQVIQAQLKTLGFEIEVQGRQDFFEWTQSADFGAGIDAIATLPTGDPYFFPSSVLTTGAVFNNGKYSNAQVDRLVDQMRAESDAARRDDLSRQVQEIVRADAVVVPLLSQPRVEAYCKGKLKNYTPHPNDLYLIDTQMSVE